MSADVPPPLSHTSEQLHALQHCAAADPAGAQRGRGKAILTACSTGTAPAQRLQRGFLDVPPRRAAAEAQKPPGRPDKLPRLRGRAAAHGPAIPDCMRLPPDPAAEHERLLKAQLIERLRPTPDTVAEVMKRPELLAGFNDPEVMAAVADIAADSQNLKKYKNSTKVMQFYKLMGSLMAPKLVGS